MRISLKFIAISWLVLLLIICGLLFNAYSKFKPETFIALLTEQVQKNYPGAKLNVGKIAYKFSLDFNLKLREIHLRRSGKLLGSIGEVELKVPWWLLLVNRGNAQINLSRLDIYVDHFEEHTAKTADKAASPSGASQNNKLIKVELPDYLAEAKFTLRAKSIAIRDIHNARRYFTVSKLLVREFQYGKNSAFELNIPIEITHNKHSYLSDLWLFGDITPEPSEWKLNYRGEFRTRESSDKFQIEDLVINGSSIFAPETLAINSDIQLFNEKDPIGKGLLLANQDGLSINLNFSKLPMSYFTFFYEVIKNPYLVKLEGSAAGEFKFQKNFDSSIADVAGKLSFDGAFFINPQNEIPGKWQVSFQNNRWEVSFMGPKGEASFFRRSFLDSNKNRVGQFTEEIGFTGLDLNLVIQTLKPFQGFLLETGGPHYRTSVSYKDCLQNDSKFDGTFVYGSTPGQKFYQGDFSGEKSSFKISYAQKSIQKSLDITGVEFPWYESYSFLSPWFSAKTGKIQGKVEGRWEENWQSGKWLVDLKASSLDSAQGLVPDFLLKTASIFDLKDKFYTQASMNFSIRNNIWSIQSLLLDGLESVKISGSLSSKQKSVLTLSYPKNKKLKAIKKEVLEPYWLQKEDI